LRVAAAEHRCWLRLRIGCTQRVRPAAPPHDAAGDAGVVDDDHRQA
jgi:hypothetical protein